MKPILCIYSSRYGQTERITHYISQILKSKNFQVDCRSIHDPLPQDVSNYSAILIGSSIYKGQHSRHLARWARSIQKQAQLLPTALFLVNLNAADPRAEARFADKMDASTDFEIRRWSHRCQPRS